MGRGQLSEGESPGGRRAGTLTRRIVEMLKLRLIFISYIILVSVFVFFFQEHPDYNTDRCHAFVCDITDKEFVFPFPDESLDIIILIFVLSAIHPDK